MIYSLIDRIQIMAEFGTGSLAVGAGKYKDEECWFITITNSSKPAEIGSDVSDDDVDKNSNKIVLTFPNENQMLKVMAAFTNKQFEEVVNKWMKKKGEMGWIKVDNIDKDV